ncbi:glucoamylase family protein [Phytohabitans kaempferiae]|uniref:Glucoamylase family protein n=1 Tax=Phytohabitans kaempferiae TaxID=1620943 RepID=A0ABV6LW73_9ACTN
MNETELRRCARDTWYSLTTLVDEGTGLPSDQMDGAGSRVAYTSPTNIAGYLWSALAVHQLGFVTDREVTTRIAQVLDTLARIDRHEPSGMYYNWYTPDTCAVMKTWPKDGVPVDLFLSSVDNAWLAASLWLVCQAAPSLARPAAALLDSMDFRWHYDPAVGLLRGGFWTSRPDGPSVLDDQTLVFHTPHHYGVLNSETRIASYVGIALGQLEPDHYFRLWRVPPDSAPPEWRGRASRAAVRAHLGVPVTEGCYRYGDISLVPSWGGGMFEALMVPILIPEARWGKGSWAVNHRRYVDAQIAYCLRDAAYGYWGLSPCKDPAGDYGEYGVPHIGIRPEGEAAGTGPDRAVVTPHASFLALDHRPREALHNLARLRRDFALYGPGGYYDSVNVVTGEVSEHYLTLDQAMILGAIANLLRPDCLRRYCGVGAWREAIRPLLKMERFRLG